MAGNVGLSLFRNFVTGADGKSNVDASNENEQARFTLRADGLELTSYDVSGTGNAIGRGFERFTRFFGRVFSIGRAQPPHKNFEVRDAFRKAILAHLQRELETFMDDLPECILDAFKGELWTNKPLTKRRIQQVLASVDGYVSMEKAKKAEEKRGPGKIDDMRISRTGKEDKMFEMKEMTGEVEETKPEIKNEEQSSKVKQPPKKEEKEEKVEEKKEIKNENKPLEIKVKLGEPIKEPPKIVPRPLAPPKPIVPPKNNIKVPQPNKPVLRSNKPVPKPNINMMPGAKNPANPVVGQPKPIVPPKNVVAKPEAKVDKAVTEKYLDRGVFRNDVFSEINQGGKTQKAYIAECNKLLHDKIIPNCLPGLKAKIEALRQETFVKLGIPGEYRDWFNKECYLLDTDSDRFLDQVREKLPGKSVAEAEKAIINACQVKSQYKFDPEGGGNSIIKNFLPVSDGSDAIVPDGSPVTLESFDNATQQFAKDNGCKISGDKYDTAFRDLLEKAGKAKEIDRVFQDFRKNGLGNLRKSTFDMLGIFMSENDFSDKDKESIKEQICKLVFGPLENKERVWQIEPNDYMRKLTEVCARSNGNMKEALADFLQNLATDLCIANFTRKGDDNVRSMITNTDLISTNDQKGRTPGQIIGDAIRANKGIHQVGAQNCFMVSMVNALLGNERGRKLLQSCFCQNDGRFHFRFKRDGLQTISARDVEKWQNRVPQLKDGSMSSLERTIWVAWLTDKYGSLDGYLEAFPNGPRRSADIAPGNACPALDFAYLFGLTTTVSKEDSTANGGVKFPENKFAKWMEVHNQLAEGQIAIVHKKVNGTEHYEAIVDVDNGQKDKKNQSFKLCDSMGGESSFDVDGLERRGGTVRQIILLTLPEA